MKLLPHLLIALALLLPGHLFAQDDGSRRSDRLSQTFNGLRVTPFNLEVASGQIRVVLKFENVTAERGSAQIVAFAAKASGSDGMADFWKMFPPQAVAQLTDNSGNTYSLGGTTGLRFARDANDWILLNPGGSVPITYSFLSGNQSNRASFNFSAELRLVWFDESGEKHLGSFQIYFPSLQR